MVLGDGARAPAEGGRSGRPKLGYRWTSRVHIGDDACTVLLVMGAPIDHRRFISATDTSEVWDDRLWFRWDGHTWRVAQIEQ